MSRISNAKGKGKGRGRKGGGRGGYRGKGIQDLENSFLTKLFDKFK